MLDYQMTPHATKNEETEIVVFLAYWPIGHKLVAWPGVGVVVVDGSRQQFFQPLLIRNYWTEYFKIIYTASLYRRL